MTTGIELIAAERRRQIDVEKWSNGHDDEHDEGQLARAAACYALPDSVREWNLGPSGRTLWAFWPFDAEWWKPTPDNRIRELAKAGALIAAEIDRLQRKEKL